MKRDRIYRAACILAVAAIGLLGQTATVYATTYYWDGNGSTSGTNSTGTWGPGNSNWNTAQDQSGTWTDQAGIVSTSYDDLSFPAATGTSTSSPSAGTVTVVGDGSGTVYANSLTMTRGAALTISAASAKTLSLGGTGAINIATSLTMNIGTATNSNLSISASNGMDKQGAGTLNLYGTNSITGNATVDAGKLSLFGPTSWTGSTTINGTGSLVVASTNSYAMNNFTCASSGSLTVQSAGTLTLSGTNSISGATIIWGNSPSSKLSISAPFGSGPLNLGGGTNVGSAYNATLQATGTFTLNNSQIILGYTSMGQCSTGTIEVTDTNTMSYGNAIVNNGSTSPFSPLTKAGTGTLLLYGSNTYSGSTTISAGTLQIGNGSNTGTPGSGIINDNASLVFNRNDTLTVSNSISGTGTVTQSGSGTLTLSGTKTYTGATIVGTGTLYLTGSSLSANNDIQVAQGATYQVLVSATTSMSLYSRLTTTTTGGLYGKGKVPLTESALTNSTIGMQWSARPAGEVQSGDYLASDVLTLAGTGSSAYVADMVYTPSQLKPGLTEDKATLGWYNTDHWDYNAVDGNSGIGISVTSAMQDYQGSWANFVAAYPAVTAASLANYVGAYGVDTTGHEAWAVVNHAGQFAVVPEPATLLLLATGLLGLLACAWRKRR